jgi:hypothetical protein
VIVTGPLFSHTLSGWDDVTNMVRLSHKDLCRALLQIYGLRHAVWPEKFIDLSSRTASVVLIDAIGAAPKDCSTREQYMRHKNAVVRVYLAERLAWESPVFMMPHDRAVDLIVPQALQDGADIEIVYSGPPPWRWSVEYRVAFPRRDES